MKGQRRRLKYPEEVAENSNLQWLAVAWLIEVCVKHLPNFRSLKLLLSMVIAVILQLSLPVCLLKLTAPCHTCASYFDCLGVLAQHVHSQSRQLPSLYLDVVKDWVEILFFLFLLVHGLTLLLIYSMICLDVNALQTVPTYTCSGDLL